MTELFISTHFEKTKAGSKLLPKLYYRKIVASKKAALGLLAFDFLEAEALGKSPSK
jgi:hypothetical protein